MRKKTSESCMWFFIYIQPSTLQYHNIHTNQHVWMEITANIYTQFMSGVTLKSPYCEEVEVDVKITFTIAI